jgi:hypothetical protein
MKNHTTLTLLVVLLLSLALASTALAQDETPELEIRLNRDFGYGGFGNDIQGTFSIRVSGPVDLTQVEFYIDEILLGTDKEAPFRIQFNTDNFDPGTRRIYAIGTLADGTELRTKELVQDFLSSDSAMGRTTSLLVPILVITVGAMLVSALIPMLTGKRGKQRPIGEYSAAGGTVCPRCGFPFSRRVLSPNIVMGKLERCPHCGKISIRPRAGYAELSAAEERLRQAQDETTSVEVDPDEALRRALDDSQFED